MRGDELHNEIISNPALKNIPFIFLSAITDINIIYERREKGAHAYLRKPIVERDLILIVEQHLKNYLVFNEMSKLSYIDELTGLHNLSFYHKRTEFYNFCPFFKKCFSYLF